MVLFTPFAGSWLNMAESIQRILGRRALEGQHPQTTQQIIAWLEATARGWNADPTPFVWGGNAPPDALVHGNAAMRWQVPEPTSPVPSSGANMATLNASDPLAVFHNVMPGQYNLSFDYPPSIVIPLQLLVV